MKIAASDYDGTLCINDTVAPEDLAAIRKWRAAGNVFGFVTGRDLSMIKHEIDAFNIPFDFLVCVNGAIVYDTNFHVLKRTDVSDALTPAILKHPAALASIHYQLCVDGQVYLHVFRDSWFTEMGIPYTEISYEEAVRTTGVQQISLAYDTYEEAAASAQQINDEFDGVHAHLNWSCVDVTCKGVDKAYGIQSLLEVMGWEESQILAIGDGQNDIPMLRRYGGFTLPEASDLVKSIAKEVVPGVGVMLERFL